MFIPITIDLGRSEKYILSIRIKKTGFTFSISEPGVNKNYCLRESAFSLSIPPLDSIKQIIFGSNFLTQEFLETNVIIAGTDYTIVPNEYYKNNEKGKLYSFVSQEDAKQVLAIKNSKHDSTTLFNIDLELYSFLKRSLFNPKFHHHTSRVIDYFDDKTYQLSLRSKMCLNFHDDIMDILVYKQSQLIHCISYEDELAQSQLYFILQMWQKCGLNQQTDLLRIVGIPNPIIVPTLQEYIKNIDNTEIIDNTSLWNEDALKAPLDLLTMAL